jgi:hypothetical protein
MKKLDPRVTEVLKKYDLATKDAVWDCHGTWVVYHKVLEQVAAKAGIIWDNPEVIEGITNDKIAVISVSGLLGDRAEWSIGEAAPYNNKNNYPWAMAEKRAKDRVILKLIGLHGLVYSEDEADDFKEKPQSSAQLKRDDVWETLLREIDECNSPVSLKSLKAAWEEEEYPKMTKAWREQADEAFEKAEEAVTKKALDAARNAPDRGPKPIGEEPAVKGILDQFPGAKIVGVRGQEKIDYIQSCLKRIGEIDNRDDLIEWFQKEKKENFKAMGLTGKEEKEIGEACRKHLKDEVAPENPA